MIIQIIHPNFPGHFLFRGWVSVDSFLRRYENYWNELEIPIFDDLIILPTEECQINFLPK